MLTSNGDFQTAGVIISDTFTQRGKAAEELVKGKMNESQSRSDRIGNAAVIEDLDQAIAGGAPRVIGAGHRAARPSPITQDVRA